MNQRLYKLKQLCYSRIIDQHSHRPTERITDQHSHRPTERHPTLARTPLGNAKWHHGVIQHII